MLGEKYLETTWSMEKNVHVYHYYIYRIEEEFEYFLINLLLAVHKSKPLLLFCLLFFFSL